MSNLSAARNSSLSDLRSSASLTQSLNRQASLTMSALSSSQSQPSARLLRSNASSANLINQTVEVQQEKQPSKESTLSSSFSKSSSSKLSQKRKSSKRQSTSLISKNRLAIRTDYNPNHLNAANELKNLTAMGRHASSSSSSSNSEGAQVAAAAAAALADLDETDMKVASSIALRHKLKYNPLVVNEIKRV
jgi:hypothetical protein